MRRRDGERTEKEGEEEEEDRQGSKKGERAGSKKAELTEDRGGSFSSISVFPHDINLSSPPAPLRCAASLHALIS